MKNEEVFKNTSPYEVLTRMQENMALGCVLNLLEPCYSVLKAKCKPSYATMTKCEECIKRWLDMETETERLKTKEVSEDAGTD